MKSRFPTAIIILLSLTACSSHDDPTQGTGGQSASASAAASVAGGAPSEVPAPVIVSAATVLDCKSPVARGASAKALLAAYGDNAQLGSIPGAEGETSQGVLLYDKIPARKLQIVFWDDAMQHVSDVSPGDKAVAWTGPSGIHAGSTLKYIEGVNGKPFKISGFGWDYGGFVTDFNGGRLDHLAGGCKLSLRFTDPDSGAAPPDGVSGDGVSLSSDDPRLQKWGPKVSDFSIGWAKP